MNDGNFRAVYYRGLEGNEVMKMNKTAEPKFLAKKRYYSLVGIHDQEQILK